MSYTEAVARVVQIQAELEALRTGVTRSGSASPSFADTLAGMQSSSGAESNLPAASTPAYESAMSNLPAASTPAYESAMSNLPTASTPAYESAMPNVPGASTPALQPAALALADTALPPAAQGMLTADQQQFASRLAADTGLDPQVISAWLLAEESGEAASSREAEGNNDWLNIGYTDSGTYGSGDSVWGDPITAADATAGWLAGRETIPGYGTASSGIQAILTTGEEPAQAQIEAIQQSGWASSGYPDLPALYQQLAE